MHPIILHVIAISVFLCHLRQNHSVNCKLKPCHPSSHCSKSFFLINFHQNRCSRQSLVEVFGPSYALCHYPQQIFVILAKVVAFVVSVIFIAVFGPSPMQSAVFLVIFVKMVVFVAFVGVFKPSRASRHCTQQFVFGNLRRNCNICQNSCFRRFHWLLKIEPSHVLCHCTQQFFRNFP